MILRLLAIILLLIPGGACSRTNTDQSFTPPAEIKFSLPARTGKFGVGRQLTRVRDESRDREIVVWLYYPADYKADESESETILPPEWAASYRPYIERKTGKPAADGLLNAKTSAKTDRLAASISGNFPVLLFAPGLNWLPTDYSATLEELAGQGFIVAALAAAPLSPVVPLADGSFQTLPVRADYEIAEQDFRFVRDQLSKFNTDEKLKIKGRLDLAKIGAFGHSIGGAAAVWAMSKDPEIKAAANLDGDFAGGAETSMPGQPVLYITTEPPQVSGAAIEKWSEDRSETRRNNVWERVKTNSSAAFRVRIPAAFHLNFLDAALLSAEAMPTNLRKDRFGKIDGLRGINITAGLLVKFFDAQLNNQTKADFSEMAKKYSEIRIEPNPL